MDLQMVDFLFQKILYYKCKSINPRGSILYSGEYGEISIPDCYFIMLEQIEKLEVERDDKVGAN